jgi:hypothetical protein
MKLELAAMLLLQHVDMNSSTICSRRHLVTSCDGNLLAQLPVIRCLPTQSAIFNITSFTGIFVEYNATMESCSDKFHVDIPNVVSARARCAYRVRMARCLLYLALIVAIVLLLPQRRKELRITITVIVITL